MRQMATRPILHKCPNYQNCLIGYRGEAVEVYREMAAICPECGSALVRVRKPTPAFVAVGSHLLILCAIAALAWAMWPKVAALFEKPKQPDTAPQR
jgi:hypothetical protein